SRGPAPAGRVDQHAPGRSTATNHIKSAIVDHHPVPPARLDHGTDTLPLGGPRRQPPEVVLRRPMVMAEAKRGHVRPATHVDGPWEPRCGEVVPRLRQGWS